MSKILKKSLSLVLALILTLSVGLFAFAAEPEEPKYLTEEEAEELAVEFLTYRSCSHITTEDYYSDGVYYKNVEVYKVISTVILQDGSLITFTSYVDKYDGKVYSRNAKYWLPIASELNPLTKDEAFEYVLKAFCVNEDDIVILESEAVVSDNGKNAYHFLFCEDVYERHECIIEADSGFIDDIVIMRPANFIDRIVLLLRVIFARIFNGSIFFN